MQVKQQKEAAFHDAAYSMGVRKNVSNYYLILDSCHAYYRDYLRRQCKDAHVLEIGCGQDSNALFMARHGAARVTGIDISSVAIQQAKELARSDCNSAKVDLRVMDAEVLAVADNSLDLVCGVAILHHLELQKVLSEMARTLKPGGTAIFLEPLAHNPAINLYRRCTPHLRTEDEHPLTMADLRMAEKWFGHIEKRYFHLFSLMAAPLHRMPGFQTTVHILDSLDQAVFAVTPFVGRYAWTVGLIFSKPVKGGSRGQG